MIANLVLLRSNDAAEDLRTIESRIKVFCPFEAIGMVHQEIRHSNFLAYIHDPKRPHGMGSHLLEALIDELRAADPEQWPDDLIADRRMPLATIERERMNIDLLIEIPGLRGAKNLVIAIEVKVYAGEGEDQLNRYERKLRNAYPTSHWHLRRAFLTLNGREAQTAGGGAWQPISFERLCDRFKNTIKSNQLTGPAVALYQNYEMMMRRHGMAQRKADSELDAAVKRLWSDHREALELLIRRRPAPVQDLIREFDKTGLVSRKS